MQGQYNVCFSERISIRSQNASNRERIFIGLHARTLRNGVIHVP